MALPASGNNSDSSGSHGSLEPMFNVSTPVIISTEVATIIDFVPGNAIVGDKNLVRFNPLLSLFTTLGHNTNPCSLDGTGDLNPLVSIVPLGNPGLGLGIKSGDSRVPAGPDGGVRDGKTQANGIAVKHLFVLFLGLKG